MAKVISSIDIAAPADRIFGVIREPRTLADLWPSLETVNNVRLMREGEGSSYSWVCTMGGERFTGTAQVIECVADRRYVVQDRGDIESIRDIQLQPENGVTRCLVRIEYTAPLPPCGQLDEAVLLREHERGLDTFLQNLKTRLEA